MTTASWIVSAFESPSGAIAGKVAIIPILPNLIIFSGAAFGFKSLNQKAVLIIVCFAVSVFDSDFRFHFILRFISLLFISIYSITNLNHNATKIREI